MNESQDSFDAQSTFIKQPEDDRSATWVRDNDEDDTETIRGSIGGHMRKSIGGGSQKDDSKKEHQSRILRLPFEKILEQSWVYKRNQRNSCDCSFISSAERSHTWSVFSGFSLADVSILSVIAMPLTTMDLANGEYYEVETPNEGLTWSPEDFDEPGNLICQEEKETRDWMSESSSEEDAEAFERAYAPLSGSDRPGEDGEMNYKSEGGIKDYDDELCQCTGCQGVSW